MNFPHEKHEQFLEDRYGDEGTYFDIDINIEYHIDRGSELDELKAKLKELIEDYGFEYQIKG